MENAITATGVHSTFNIRSLSPRHILVFELVAFAIMLIDHMGRSHIFSVPGWEIIGRTGFPLFAMTFAHNAATYQRCNVKKLVLLGLVALPATSYLLDLTMWWQPNIMFAFPLGWYVYRFFADPQAKGNLFLKPLGLWLAVAALSLGPVYDLRGILLIATAIGFFACRDRTKARWLGWGCVLFSLSTVIGTPYKIIPATALLAVIYGLVMLLPAGQIVRRRATWWDRLGFGKWYVLHAYVLAGVKLLMTGYG